MEFLKNFFKDEETVIGLSSFKKKTEETKFFTPKFDATKPIYCTNYEKNFFLL